MLHFEKLQDSFRTIQGKIDGKTTNEQKRIASFMKFINESFDDLILDVLQNIDEKKFTKELADSMNAGKEFWYVDVLDISDGVSSDFIIDRKDCAIYKNCGRDFYQKANSLGLLGKNDESEDETLDVASIFHDDIFRETQESSYFYPAYDVKELVDFDLLPKTRDYAKAFEKKFPSFKLAVERYHQSDYNRTQFTFQVHVCDSEKLSPD